MSRIFDFFKGLISLALVLCLLFGIPALLLIIVGYPLPTEMPSIELIRRHITDGQIPDAVVVKTLAVFVWLVWFQLAVAVLTEAFALARGRVSGRAPIMPGLQMFAGKLVASTVLIVSAFTPSRAATAAPIMPIEASQAEVISTSPDAGTPFVSRSGRLSGAVPAAGGLTLAADVDRAAGHYETNDGDSWWDLAERLLGDGMRWSELRDLNSGKTMLTGDVVSAQTEIVRGGWQLDVPGDADSSLLQTGAVIEMPAAALAPGETLAEVAGTASPDPSPVSAVDDSAVHESSPLMQAIKPYTLVYEGPTGAQDVGPGVPYQVVEGDNLWDIAERHLNDPFRWPEIFENSNEIDQSFGRRITDPNLIWPDSILWLPSDAVDVPTADPDLVNEAIGVLTAVESEHDEAKTELTPETLRGATAAAAETITHDDPGSPTNPEDGDRKQPADPAAESPGEESNSDEDKSLVELLANPQGLAFGAGGLLVATGMLGMVHRSRKVRLSEAGERSQPAPPPMELVEMETVMRNSADRRRAVSVHSAIRSLADRPIVVGEPLATPEVVRISGDRIEVVQRGADPDLPAPWIVGENSALDGLGGRSLAVLPVEFFPEEPDNGEFPEVAAPTCVTVGGGMLLNLEAVGVVLVEGPAEMTAGLIRSMVHELATGPARRSIDLRVSNWLPGADLHEHVRCGPLDNLSGELQPWLEDVELSLAASGAFSAYAVRASGAAESLPVTRVIFADAADAANLAPIIERARRHALPLAVVFSGELSGTGIDPAVTIALDGDSLRLEPYGFTAATQYLDVDLVLGAEALVNHARQAPMVPRLDEQSTILPMSEHDTDPAQVGTEETPETEVVTELPADEHEITDQAEPEDSGILIRVLGRVEFEGGPPELSEEEQSILAFLALVGPSTAVQIQDAIWPGSQVDVVRFNTIIDHLRAVLRHRFPDSGDGRYRVRSIITDLGSARRWIAQAEAMSPDRARNLLQLALSEVRGEPFAGVTERLWQWVADHKMAIETQASTMLMDACFDLCDNAYAANDIHLAKWACDVGSLIDPLHETVVTRRIQLMQVLGMHPEAAQILEDWEILFSDVAGRPAPRGPRTAFETAEAALAQEASAPYVS